MDAHATGRGIMVELMGAEYVASRETHQRNEFNSVIQDYSTEVCFGRIWAREGLDRKLRSAITIAMLTALNRPSQLRHHVAGALKNGCTVLEIQEILLQSAVYCGLPAAAEAFKVAEQVLEEHQLLD